MAIDFRNQSTKTTAISGYKPFYIQKANGSIVDTRTEWGLVAKSNPYPLLPTPKEPYNNDWKDEDGADEYNKEMYYEPTEFSVAFYVKAYASGSQTAAEVLRSWMLNFFDYVKAGEFRTFDAYTAIGFRKVRFDGYEQDYFKARSDWAAAAITVKFKANDPTTKMYLTNSTDILPQWSGTTSTGASTTNKLVTGVASGFSVATGVQIAVRFTVTNTASSVALKIGSNGAAYVVTHVPAAGLNSGYTYLFRFTGSVWDCQGMI